MSEIYVDGINLERFPHVLHLRYGEEGNREWYEFSRGRRAVVIQRYRGEPWIVFFVEGDTVRTLNEKLTEEDIRSGIVAKPFQSFELQDCIKALETLGFKVVITK